MKKVLMVMASAFVVASALAVQFAPVPWVEAKIADAVKGEGKVQSVNSQTGAVVVTAADLGAVATNDLATATNALAEAIANATPANYAAVSNAAMTALQPAATNGLANSADVYKKSETYSQTEINTKIANATPSDYADVKSKAESALQSESDPKFSAFLNSTNIVIGKGAYMPDTSVTDATFEGVAIGPNTYGVLMSFATSYDASHFNLGSKLVNGVITHGVTLQSLLDEKYPAADGTALASRVTSAESSIQTINAANYVTQTTADASYYPKASGDAWSSYWDGDDVRVTVTNYDSVAHLPSLYLEQRTNDTASASDDGAFRTVWRELAHWEAFLGEAWDWDDSSWQGFAAWKETVADRAWGFYDSHTGAYAPDGYTSISSSNVMICAGASYQKTATATCDVWVLTANEPYEPTGVSTNGGFQIKDADGNVQFEIVKGDKATVKAQANGVSVDSSTTPNTLVVTYNIVADSAPTGEVCLDLATAQWKAETDSDCPATVVWSGSSGAWVARITPTASTDKCFFKATYQVGGDTYVNNRCAVGMSQLVLGGTTYNLGTAVIDGHTVLTLTPAQ